MARKSLVVLFSNDAFVRSYSADEIGRAFSQNNAIAERDFTGRTLSITGKVRQIENDFITLEAEGTFLGIVVETKSP